MKYSLSAFTGITELFISDLHLSSMRVMSKFQ